ncbi:hypothetical protein HMSSN036_51370 [Paenibacillus macerans]|nr:hypothetical protein HMSSN036_51370 [Paenibacillus macerans]
MARWSEVLFFLGSGVGIKAAGPSILIAYIIGGALVYIILYALSEMTVADPVSGSFRTYAERSFGAGAGFVTGWVYWIGLIFAMSSESIAASTFLRVWFPNLSPGFTGTVIVVAVTLLNLLGAKYLSNLESGLAAIKLIAIAGFIAIGLAIIAGLMPGIPAVGAGELRAEPWLPGGIAGIAGSMLTVVLTYAGFEVIGLAASEVRDPRKTIPRAINLTLISLIGLYVASIAVILPLFPTGGITADESPLVLALTRWGMGWASTLMNIVMITAILSTMLAAMFGLGRMIRSLAAEGHAPNWLKDKTDVPYRGILFSGAAMLAGLGLGYLLPQQVYLFLLSLGGFSLLFSYFVILASHYKWRRHTPCSPGGRLPAPRISLYFLGGADRHDRDYRQHAVYSGTGHRPRHRPRAGCFTLGNVLSENETCGTASAGLEKEIHRQRRGSNGPASCPAGANGSLRRSRYPGSVRRQTSGQTELTKWRPANRRFPLHPTIS